MRKLVSWYVPPPQAAKDVEKVMTAPRHDVSETARAAAALMSLSVDPVLSMMETRGKPDDVRDGVCVRERVMDGVRVALAETLGVVVTVGVTDGVELGVDVGEGVCVPVRVPVPVEEGDWVSDGDPEPLPLRVPETLGVPLVLGVSDTLCEGVPVPLRVPDDVPEPEIVPDALGVDEALGVAL